MARNRRKTNVVDPAVDSQLAIQLPPEAREMLDQLEQQRATLELRLRAGEEYIATARGRNEDVSRWESHWLGLLNEYEEVSLQIELLLDCHDRSANPQLRTSAA